MTRRRFARRRRLCRIALPLLSCVFVVLIAAGASSGASNPPWTGTMSYQFTSDGNYGDAVYGFLKIEGSMTVKLGNRRADDTYDATFTGRTTLTFAGTDNGLCGRPGNIEYATYTNQPGTAFVRPMGSGNNQIVWDVTPDPPSVGASAKSSYKLTFSGQEPGGNGGCVPWKKNGYTRGPVGMANAGCVIPLKGFTTWPADGYLADTSRIVGRFAHASTASLDVYCAQVGYDFTKYSMTAEYNLVRAGASAGVPAATAFTDTFTAAGQAKPHAVAVPAGKAKAEITLAWTKPGDRFTIADVVLVPKRKTASVARAEKLKITFFSLTPTSMGVRIGNLAPGKLTFRVVSKKQNGTTTVRTRVILKA